MKLKDIDFISYKLFRHLKSVLDSQEELKDEDDNKTPEQYCKDIQNQF